jgi:drug/metabolite transporter (DMT)-like permease
MNYDPTIIRRNSATVNADLNLMYTLILLLLITLCYAAYHLLVKVSSNYGGAFDAAPILATLSLQATALVVSLAYFFYLISQDVSVTLPGKAYIWAIGAGLCIGLAEIMYFYLFRGVAGEKPMAASTAIPFIVGGTIVVTVLVSMLVFRETLNPGQWIGVSLALIGMVILGLNTISAE